MLKVHQASKSYGQTQVFSDISFEVSAQKILGIAGPSGSGKSTLLHCIQELEPLTKGAITMTGNSVLMLQDFQLFPHMSVMENIIYAPRLQDKTVNHGLQAEALLSKLNMLTLAEAYPHQLSGGQKQRVALARCLMMNPCWLICDEPTSGLDVGMIDEVVNLLRSVQEMGVGMVIASHDLNFLLALADNVVVLKDGRKVMDKPASILKTQLFELKQILQVGDSDVH
ncbi:MAG: ATP-binding cassette domain-containing protein [Gammaproteobacteria bacterium]|nr:ATP-binding cassette domain-containing protein [Gammaproteobacteria bacterium]